jgi:hypothetical protein
MNSDEDVSPAQQDEAVTNQNLTDTAQGLVLAAIGPVPLIDNRGVFPYWQIVSVDTQP